MKVLAKTGIFFSKMSKLILQTLETGFKNLEKRILGNNPQMKFLVKHVCVFFFLKNVKTGFENPEKES